MGATYTRQSSYTDGDTITAAHTNDEFQQLLAAFTANTGHTHDGTAGEGGPITSLLGTSITIGNATAGTDITVTYDGESNDGVMKWMEDEDYFEFSDDILMATTEKIQFTNTSNYIHSASAGNIDLVAATEIHLVSTTINMDGAVDISGAFTLDGATLAETISDTVGAMVTSNTETGISVTYDDADNTIDFVVGAGAIVNSMLADDAVGADELAANAVVTASIVDANVTTAKIADGNVTTAKIAADAITGAKIADDAINSEHYADGSIDTAHIADLQITTGLIAADAITGAKIADDAIDSEHYAADSIDNEHLANDAVGADELASNAVVTASIVDANVTLAKIANQAANTVLVRDANSSGVVSAKALATTEILIGDGTGFTAAALSGDVTMTNAGVVTIGAGAVENSMLADDAVGADELAANAVVNASVAAGAAINFSKMENLTTARALVSDGNGDVSVSAVTATEVGYLDGVTSAIQTQLNATASKGFATAMAIAL